VATRDRLGRGQKIEIKPLTGIVEKLRKKKEEVRSRAAALRAPEVPTFDDILQDAGLGVSKIDEAELKKNSSESCADLKTLPADADVDAHAASDEPLIQEEQINTDLSKVECVRTDATTDREPKTPRKQHAEEDDDDLEVVSDREEDGLGDFKLIDVPRMTPTKPSPLAFNAYNATQDVEDFEDEELLEDGGEMDSESESDHSWAVRQEEEEDDDVVSSKEEGSQHIDDDNLKENDSPSGDENDNGNGKIDPLAKMMANRERVSGSMKNQDAKIEKQRGFIDEEAELSEDDGMRHAVSDDEDEDAEDLDKNGELADLIDEGKTTLKDQNATESLHIQWAKQQDAQQLKDILRGLENGFGRRRHGAFGDELDGELTGRQRRARYDDDDDLDLGLSTAWPSLFGNPAAVGDGAEECEDEAMLRKAHQRKLVESQLQQDTFGSIGPSIPLDKDSQNILELFAKGSSEQQNQHNNSSSGSGSLKRGRSKELLFGSDPLSAFGSSGPSFIGRQSKAQKTQNASTIAALGSAKSFVFGRKEQNSSSSRLGSDDANTSGSEPIADPVDFSNLKQLTRSHSTDSNNKALKSSNSSLLRNMSKCHKPSKLQKSNSVDLVGAVCNQIAKAKRKPL